ncbi:hypothetical protein HNR00_003016 [Methylorubrum rhodinum]|uniref:Uncharacterized protein n=1 Tax=Methylorubrum rhodinum TaxID=29428 RepID=A0A840ZMK3_9HYPH|nr:hypothetical protein [Methylorubrum rhodinum]MBB5758298.1 hypothetical protein [Methylorubrum rhodinum]
MNRLVALASGLLRRALHGKVPRLFDAAYYRARNPGVAKSGLDPFLHYVWLGARRDRNPNADFDTAFYRRQSGPTRLDPVRHYLREGAAKGLDPSPAFSTALYLARYPDVVAAGVNPLVHFRNDGRAEGREAAPSPIEPDRLRALDGVAEDHILMLPDAEGGRFSLALERHSDLDPAAEFAPRLCLQLCVDGLEYDALLDALRAFEAGRQDSLALDIDTSAGPHPPMPTQLLAFERCFLARSDEGRTWSLRYAELRVWDLRLKRPGVAAVFPGGGFSARRLAKGEGWPAM